MDTAKKYNLPAKSVLVVGSQHGYEPQMYKELGVDVISVDIVKSFVEDTRKKGVTCHHSPIEEFEPIKVDGVHASHVLEHTYDIRKAISVIKECAQYWCYVAVPITPEGQKAGRGDLSVIRNKNKILELFKPWQPNVIHKTKGTIVVLFTAQNIKNNKLAKRNATILRLKNKLLLERKKNKTLKLRLKKSKGKKKK
ncbi:MAG: class I SAM-dependent methyltransferase [bacterium]|nr:class I SAM-dependent methyltransferase [bacterium]